VSARSRDAAASPESAREAHENGDLRAPGASVAPREPWLSTLLRALVHGLAAGVFAWPLAVSEGVVAAAVGGLVGALVARGLVRTRLRLGTLVALAVVALVGVLALGGAVTGGDALAGSLGPSRALRVGDVLVFGPGALVVSAALRMLAARVRALAVLEVGAVALAFAQLVVAHRNGAINRPFELADPILARGGDPSLAILAVGAGAVGVVVVLLLSERSAPRALFGLGLLAALLAGLLVVTARAGLPAPPQTGGGLGLRGDGEGRSQRQQGRGRGGRASEDLEFRDDYGASNRQVPVAVVLLHDDYSPPTGNYYFRQSAFSHYNGRRLVSAMRGDVDRDLARAFPTERSVLDEGPPAGADRATLRTTVALLADHARPFGLEAPVELAPATNPDPGRFKRTYSVTSSALTSDARLLLGLGAGSPAWSDEVRAYYTAGPADPRYGELARTIVATLPEALREDPLARALAITSWLGREGIYSLRSRHAGAEDPTAHFLFGDKTGYCVHFAHAAAYLMRSVGVPARVATGYVVDESARQGGSAILVTGDRSHAWPEIYLEGVGWVIADVAPERSLDPPPGPPDPDLQRLLGELARGELPLPVDGSPAPEQIAALARRAGRSLATWSGAALAALLTLLYLAKLWRRLAPRVLPASALPRVGYRATLDRLAEAGITRLSGESREAFAERLARTLPSLAPLTHAHHAARFGGTAPDAATLRALARAVTQELALAVPRRRRALGLLAPWTFLRVR
jgi:hypothetical protein